MWYFFLKFIWKSKIFIRFDNLQKLLTENVDDILIAIIIWVLLWWRLGEVFIYQWEYFSNNLWQILAVRNWGMSFIGGILGVLVSLIILKKIKKLSNIQFWLLIDIILVVVPLAIMFGRFGNFLNQEIYWLVVPNDFWGMSDFWINLFTNLKLFYVYDMVDSNLRVNTNFISILFEWLFLFVIIASVFWKRIKLKIIKPWMIAWLFLLFYSIFRFFIEYLRIDSQSQFVWIFTRSQWIFLFFIVIGMWFVFNKKFKKINL
jgi:phosphatidylglycerol---prolipoprotein diacylglyceryl transferase